MVNPPRRDRALVVDAAAPTNTGTLAMPDDTKSRAPAIRPDAAPPAAAASAFPEPWMTQPMNLWRAWTEYATDAAQRTILFWDALRERGNVYVEHERDGKPPVLAFEHDVVMDARTLPDPANYALLRIRPPAETPTDPAKRPFVVVDPRAGHGPGIGASTRRTRSSMSGFGTRRSFSG